MGPDPRAIQFVFDEGSGRPKPSAGSGDGDRVGKPFQPLGGSESLPYVYSVWMVPSFLWTMTWPSSGTFAKSLARSNASAFVSWVLDARWAPSPLTFQPPSSGVT